MTENENTITTKNIELQKSRKDRHSRKNSREKIVQVVKQYGSSNNSVSLNMSSFALNLRLETKFLINF